MVAPPPNSRDMLGAHVGEADAAIGGKGPPFPGENRARLQTSDTDNANVARAQIVCFRPADRPKAALKQDRQTPRLVGYLIALFVRRIRAAPFRHRVAPAQFDCPCGGHSGAIPFARYAVTAGAVLQEIAERIRHYLGPHRRLVPAEIPDPWLKNTSVG